MSDPWFRFFPSDWISGVSGLSAAERGVYVTLLAIIYDRGGPVERDDTRLARQCGLPKAGFARSLQALIDTGKITEDGVWLSNNRAKNELTERENRIVKAKDAAVSSWEKRKQNQSSKNRLAEPEQSDSNATCARVPQPQPEPEDKNTEIQETSLGGLVASTPSPRKAKRAKARTQIDENAQPDEKDRVTAAEHGLSAELFRSEWRKFRDHHLAHGSLFSDWHAAWRKWCGNIPQFQQSNARAGPAVNRGGVGKLLYESLETHGDLTNEKRENGHVDGSKKTGIAQDVCRLPFDGMPGRNDDPEHDRVVSGNSVGVLIGNSYRRM